MFELIVVIDAVYVVFTASIDVISSMMSTTDSCRSVTSTERSAISLTDKRWASFKSDNVFESVVTEV